MIVLKLSWCPVIHFRSLWRVLNEELQEFGRLLYHIQDVPGGKVSILGGHSIDHSEHKYVDVKGYSSECFTRQSYFSVQ
jgi:hypothetical protein